MLHRQAPQRKGVEWDFTGKDETQHGVLPVARSSLSPFILNSKGFGFFIFVRIPAYIHAVDKQVRSGHFWSSFCLRCLSLIGAIISPAGNTTHNRPPPPINHKLFCNPRKRPAPIFPLPAIRIDEPRNARKPSLPLMVWGPVMTINQLIWRKYSRNPKEFWAIPYWLYRPEFWGIPLSYNVNSRTRTASFCLTFSHLHSSPPKFPAHMIFIRWREYSSNFPSHPTPYQPNIK